MSKSPKKRTTPSAKVERVRGASDLLPGDYEINKQIEGKLERCFRSFGYRPIDVPVVEHTELYLKKSGAEVVSRLYDFTYHNRRLCLRPEMTASVIRAYVDHLQGAPLPVRLYYAGPVFRYEKPQRERYRQFTQMGVELIGAAGPMADAEVIYTACKGLNSLGLADYRLVIGHVGILAEFLENMALESYLRSFLIANMETLRREGKQQVASRLREIYPDEQSPKDGPRSGKLLNLFLKMDAAEARMAILDLLESMNIELGDDRAPEEIADRILARIKRQDQTLQLNQALDFMSELGQLAGEPSKVLTGAGKLLASHGISHLPLDQLRAMIEVLERYDLNWPQISLDLGLSRGLQYYTGIIFEIYHGGMEEERQLCGGGRYDDLVATFGGREETPSLGFAYGLERIRSALRSEGKSPAIEHQPVDVLVIPVSPEDCGYAISVAEQLRSKGVRVVVDVRGRSVRSNFQYADKQGLPFAIVVGSEERASSEIVLKNMVSRQEQRVTVSEAAKQIGESAN